MNQIYVNNKSAGLINQASTKEVGLMNQIPTDKSSPYKRGGLMNQTPT